MDIWWFLGQCLFLSCCLAEVLYHAEQYDSLRTVLQVLGKKRSGRSFLWAQEWLATRFSVGHRNKMKQFFEAPLTDPNTIWYNICINLYIVYEHKTIINITTSNATRHDFVTRVLRLHHPELCQRLQHQRLVSAKFLWARTCGILKILGSERLEATLGTLVCVFGGKVWFCDM